MTVAELAKSLGKVGTYYPNGSQGLGFEVTVRDVRQVFGRLDFEVEPVAGRGRSWVGESSVKFPDERPRLAVSDPF